MRVRRTTSSSRHVGLWAVPVLLLALVPLASNIGGASIPDSSDVIHTCYDRDGRLRVIDTAAVSGFCKALEKPLSWNQTGPPGADGFSSAESEIRSAGPSAVAPSATHTNVVTQEVQAGPYVFLAKTVLNADPGVGSDCQLTSDIGAGEVVADTTSQSPAGTATSRVVHNLQSLLVLSSPATIRLNCLGEAAWSATNSHIIAIEVQTANISLFP